jgi:hypothetical protein
MDPSILNRDDPPKEDFPPVGFAQCNSRSIRDETSRQSIAAVIRASGECGARGAMIESDLAALEATHRNRADALGRDWARPIKSA